MGICQVNKLVVGSKNTEKGSIQIYGKDIDVLKLGDATHEGGDVKIYRDASGNLQFSLDADAASNAIAISVYGGVVAQNYLSVGTTSLSTATNFYVAGTGRTSSTMTASRFFADYGLECKTDNLDVLPINIRVSGSNATDHAVKLQIDSQDIFVVQATGDGAGGIINEAIGVFAVTPQVQQAHIADPTDLASCISALSTLLADMEGYGWLKAS
ncbi:MAG: hypothetical protein WA977_02410 [Halobacteriota archaeon]